MKNYYKLFLWENGAKVKDYTGFVVAPIFYEERLNEELDTAEIVLDNMSIASKKGFAPKTKFRIERYHNKDFSDQPQTWDMIVERDDVEVYAGCPKLCCHRLYLVEASAIAQGIHVDNIALTYKAQDVSLKYKTYSSNTETVGESNYVYGYSIPIRVSQPMALGTVYFMNSYRYVWKNTSSLEQLLKNLSANETHEIAFTIPTLYCQGALEENGEFQNLFEVRVETTITRKLIDSDGSVIEEETVFSQITGGNPPVDNNMTDQIYAIGTGTYIGSPPEYKSAFAPRIWSFHSTTSGLITSVDNLEQFQEHIDYWNGARITKFDKGEITKSVSIETETLSQNSLEDGQKLVYEVVCKCYETKVPIYYVADCEVTELTTEAGYTNTTGNDYGSYTYLNGEEIFINVNFACLDLQNVTQEYDILKSSTKYSCYEMLRKALLTCDTQIFDNENMGLDEVEYLIQLDSELEEKLKKIKMHETIFESKNLWEVLIQIGYYLHAIPYLSFANDGSDKFVLNFEQLGNTSRKNDTGAKLTIFNSQDMNEYFSQFDSYVTNFFSPQNVVEEWIVPTTNDESALISNNTAILKTTYGISEVVEFKISYDGSNGGSAGTKSALNYIFEKSIYNVLTSDYKISPGKADSLYYSMGDNIIYGLNYVPPSANNDRPMALKSIIKNIFSKVTIKDIKFNSLKFYIKYRTQDNMRVTQTRPDLENYIKNSHYEKFPHHEQFYGQQDKIIDSERFSQNLFGKLIRVGNNIYQCLEYAIPGQEKSAGDLISIDNNPYYITEIEEEWYNDATFQKVTYSKNFNQLSQIVTIPSEPRFYEVSERSKVRREIRLFDFLKISNQSNKQTSNPRYLNNSIWKSFVLGLLFNKGSFSLPNYAWTSFIADKKRLHKGSNGEVLALSQMFPSSEVARASNNVVVPVEASDRSTVIVPVLRFPVKDGILFEWDMEDNFKAGDSVDTGLDGIDNTGDLVDGAYYAINSVRYCDVLGRGDLFTFKLFNKIDWNFSQAQNLPRACIDEPLDAECQVFSPLGKVIGLDKDCREELSFNYQLNLLYRDEDDNGNFVTFSNLFGEKFNELKCCLLNKEISIFDEDVNSSAEHILIDEVVINYIEDIDNNQIKITFATEGSINLVDVRSILFYDLNDKNEKIPYIAKNYTNGIEGDSIPNLYIYPVYNNN